MAQMSSSLTQESKQYLGKAKDLHRQVHRAPSETSHYCHETHDKAALLHAFPSVCCWSDCFPLENSPGHPLQLLLTWKVLYRMLLSSGSLARLCFGARICIADAVACVAVALAHAI